MNLIEKNNNVVRLNDSFGVIWLPQLLALVTSTLVMSCTGSPSHFQYTCVIKVLNTSQMSARAHKYEIPIKDDRKHIACMAVHAPY